MAIGHRSVDNISNNRTLVITLSTVLSFVGLVTICLVAYVYLRRWRRRRGALFTRGITPINDDEIATWRLGSSDEKGPDRFTMKPKHTPNTSTSTKKASSVIQYQNDGRPSMEMSSPLSPMSYPKKSMSFDLPRIPDAAVMARAPNARSGLTDDTVPGDEPFVAPLKRNPSRLYKPPPGSSPHHQQSRSKASRSNSMKSLSEPWYYKEMEATPRCSVDAPSLSPSKKGHARIYSSSSIPPAISLSAADLQFAGLSPPPSRRTPLDEIGRAIG